MKRSVLSHSTTSKVRSTGTRVAWSEPCIAELMKRCRGIEGDDPDALETLAAREMIDATAQGDGRGEDAEDRQIALEILRTFSGEIASVTCLCHRYVDLLHLIRMPEGWRIVNAAWRLR